MMIKGALVKLVRLGKQSAFKRLQRNQPAKSFKVTRNGKGLCFGTTNIGSLNKTARKEKAIDLIRRKISILGLSETKWLNDGTKEIRKHCHIIQSGEKEGNKNGVAIFVSPEMMDEVVQVNYISGRIIRIKII